MFCGLSHEWEVVGTVPETQVQIKFQPIIDLKNWRFAGFEALARFRDGDSPVDHLNKARHEGHLTTLELSLAEAAIEEALKLPFSTTITLNVSVSSLLSDRLGELVSATHHRWGLELLETSRAGDHLDLKEKAARMGCILLVDDAGVEYSNEERIRILAPHVVKIDRGIFTAACRHGCAFDKLYELIRAGREAGSSLLVEGIERPEHLALAKCLQIDFAQGYFFGRPVTSGEVVPQLTALAERVGVAIPWMSPTEST